MHLYVLMSNDWGHATAKKYIKDGYKVEHSMNQWIVWLLEVQHVFTWNADYHVLGTNLATSRD